MPAPLSVRRRFVAGLAAVSAAAALVLVSPSPAAAVVHPLRGFRATVDGFTSWYGSYAMASLGMAWCIDHGSRAPDPAYGYAPTALPTVDADTRTAMAWVVGVHGLGTDRVRHAAVMLALHDLMGARYPSGRLDVDRLSPRRLAGFGGLEARVLEEARRLKADGLAHRHLRGALGLTVSLAPDDGTHARVSITVRDAAGRGVVGVPVLLEATGARLDAPAGTTGADGTSRTRARRGAGPVEVRARARLPRLALDAWAPTARLAQRVARPSSTTVRAAASLPALPPPTSTTTTTTAPPTTTTSTTVPPTTTTLPPTTTTLAPTTTLPAPTTTTPVTAAVPPTTSTTATPPTAPPTVAAPTPPVAALPRTGRDAGALTLLGLGLVLIGAAGVDAAGARRRA